MLPRLPPETFLACGSLDPDPYLFRGCVDSGLSHETTADCGSRMGNASWVVGLWRKGMECVIGESFSPPTEYLWLPSFVCSEPLVAPRYESSPASKDVLRPIVRCGFADSERLGWTAESTELRDGSFPSYWKLEKALRNGDRGVCPNVFSLGDSRARARGKAVIGEEVRKASGTGLVVSLSSPSFIVGEGAS